MKTYQQSHTNVKREWHLVDAKDMILGRMSSDIVKYLMGKHKPTYSPQLDMGDFVVVLNAKNVKVTGRKEKQKTYYKHSGYPGGFKEVAYSKLKKENPERIIELAVKRMLPSNRLRSKRMKRLRILPDSSNPYEEKFKKKA